MENYFFDIIKQEQQDQVLVLIIYDIVDNKKRVKFAKFLQGYGFRIQKSAFEAVLPKAKLKKLLQCIPAFVAAEDSIRLYRLQGKGQVITWGKEEDDTTEDVLVW